MTSAAAVLPRFDRTPVSLAVQLALIGVLSVTTVLPAHAEDSAAAEPARLPTVEVTGATEGGYRVKPSSTVSKTGAPLRDTPQAVTIISRDLMDDQGMQGIADAIRYVPGIVTAQGEGNRDTAIFRGNSSTGDFYVDGLRDDVQYYRDFYNIESVEALKGPNAMLFGRGGSGGIINRVSKQAEWKTIRDLSLTLGSWDQYRISTDVGQALSPAVSFRINALYENSDSYRDGFKLERAGINPTLGIRAGDNTMISLSYEHFRDDRTTDRGVPSFQGKPFKTDPSTYFGDPDNSMTWARVNAFSASIDHDFGGGVTLRNRTRYGNYDKFYQNIFPGAVSADGSTVAISAYNNATQRTNLFNQTDLMFSLNTGTVKHNFVAGLELGRQESDNFRNTGYFPGDVTSSNVPVTNPRVTDPVVFRQSATDADNHGVASVKALYIQDQIVFSPQWQAIVGLRYDQFSVDFDNRRTDTTIATRDTPLSPRLGLVYKPVEPVSIYGNYSLAFVPRAGDQLSSLTATNSAFDPEEFENLEFGIKWDLTTSLSSSVAVYRLERSNVVITDPADPTQSILVDGQRTMGLELGLGGSISKKWSVMGGYAWQDAEFTEDQSGTVLAGNTVAQVPQHTVSLWNRYQLTNAWAGAIGVIYRDSIYAGNDNTVELPSFTRFDAAVFYTVSKRLKAQLNVENLFDTGYYASSHSNNNIMPGSPRAVRLTLNASF